MANKQMKGCSKSLIRETQIKNYNDVSPHTDQNVHHQKSKNNNYWRGCREKGTPLHCWKECKLGRSLWRVWRFLKKLKIELSYDPAIPLLALYLEEISYCVSSKHWYSFQLPAWHLGFLQKPQTQYSKTSINIYPTKPPPLPILPLCQ